MRSSAPSRPLLWPILVAAAYDSIGYAVVSPVLPALRDRAGASSLAASVIFSGFSVGMAVGLAVAGSVTRRWGPRRTLLLGIAAHVVADALFVAGHSSWPYGVARLIQGLGSGGMWMGAMLGTLTWFPERPGPRIGAVLTGYAAGAVAGPLLGALGGTVRPFLADGAVGLLAVALAYRLPPGPGRHFGWSGAVLRDRRFLFGSAVVLFSSFVYASVEGSFTLRFSVGLSQTGLGALVAVMAAGGGIGALLPIAHHSAAAARRTAQVATVGCGLLVLAVTAVGSPVAWFGFLAAAGHVLGAGESGALGLVAGVAEEGLLAAMVGNAQAWALGFLVAPPAATWLAGVAGDAAPGLALAALGMVVAALGWTLAPRDREAPLAS